MADSSSDRGSESCFMSLASQFDKLTIESQTHRELENTDVDMGASDIQTQNAVPPAANIQTMNNGTQEPLARRSKEAFTFVSVYYKRGAWRTLTFDTLHEGLLELVGQRDSAGEREVLLSLGDQELLTRLLIIGASPDIYTGDNTDVYTIFNLRSQAKMILIIKGVQDL
jgi:hypothetical protein